MNCALTPTEQVNCGVLAPFSQAALSILICKTAIVERWFFQALHSEELTATECTGLLKYLPECQAVTPISPLALARTNLSHRRRQQRTIYCHKIDRPSDTLGLRGSYFHSTGEYEPCQKTYLSTLPNVFFCGKRWQFVSIGFVGVAGIFLFEVCFCQSGSTQGIMGECVVNLVSRQDKCWSMQRSLTSMICHITVSSFARKSRHGDIGSSGRCLSFLLSVSNHLQTASYHASLMTVIEPDGLDAGPSCYCHGNL